MITLSHLSLVALVAAASLAAGCVSTSDRSEQRVGASRNSPPLAIEGDDVGLRGALPGSGAGDTAIVVGGASDAVLASVGDRPIFVSELLDGLRQRDARLLNYHLNLLVGQRLAEIVADDLGLVVADQDVADRARTHEAAFVAQLDGVTFEDVLRNELGVEPAAFRRRLARDARRELVTERVVRAWTLAQECARVRILVAAPEVVADATRRHTAGESFAALAVELSRDPTGANGGLVPFIVRSERSRLARLAFRTPVGSLGGPFSIEGDGVELVLFVEEITTPIVGAWNDVRSAVETSLASHEVSEEEYLQWQVFAESSIPVDLSPISRLLGESLR